MAAAAAPVGMPHLGATASSSSDRSSSAGAALVHKDSPTPAADLVKDSKSETVAVMAPSATQNTTRGIGKPGEEQLAHLQAKPVVLGGAEGVVGEAAGKQPEWIAKVRKVRTSAEEAAMSEAARAKDEETVRGPKGDKGVPAIEVTSGSSASSVAGLSGNSTAPVSSRSTGATSSLANASTASLDGGDEDDANDDKHGPKWLRKVKEAAATVKEKATGSSGNDTADSATGGTDVAGVVSPRTSTVSFTPETTGGAPRIITDRDGKPVPLNPGATIGDDAASDLDGAGRARSTSTSVKDKVLETHDVDPRTSDEDFRAMFKDMPDDEELIEVYRCALSRDVLVQGKVYISETFLSFRANIFGWETTLQVPWSEIVSIEKRATAKIIPNAIEVRTLHATHDFASFINRDASYDLITTVWRHAHPEADAVLAGAASKSLMPERTTGEPVASSAVSTASAPVGRPKWVVPHEAHEAPKEDDKSEISYEDEHGQKKRHRFRSGLRSLGIRRHRRGSVSSTDGPTAAEKVKADAQAAADAPPGVHPPTTYDGDEYENEALDCVLPTTPLKAFKLFFVDKAFLTKFMSEKEGLKDVEIGPWKALDGTEATQDALAAAKEREIKYLKPLNAPVGPKQTHCNIRDVQEHFDEEGYFSVKTSTVTPDVPSGNDFTTVTRSVFTWAAGGGCHVRVTTEVEWTKVNRFLRGVIERGAVDGQRTYHADLEELVRERIAANPDEYTIPGVSADANTEVKANDMASKDPKRKRSLRAKSSRDSGSLLDSLTDITSPVTILLILVVLLFITNIFTLRAMRHQARLARQAHLGQPSEIASAVSRVLDNFNSMHLRHVDKRVGTAAPATDLRALQQTVLSLEQTLAAASSEMQVAVERARAVVDRTAALRRVH